ncbi:MAG TPA: SRPBCC domain-containing protein [Pseudomonadales bacterium]|nr:SRPBCC domain-containing protein [Pseudomonadales bacterium]|tara:strand:- start:177 stop:530 length:354 start_codon:yes stop_codon:yes gene_type:complete
MQEMDLWYFENIPDFQPEIGFTTRFAVESSARVFTHCWEVIESIPFNRIIYTWKHEEYQGDSLVSFQILPRDSHSLLRLTVEVLEDFPDDIPEFDRESCIAGWNFFLGERLQEYLEP